MSAVTNITKTEEVLIHEDIPARIASAAEENSELKKKLITNIFKQIQLHPHIDATFWQREVTIIHQTTLYSVEFSDGLSHLFKIFPGLKTSAVIQEYFREVRLRELEPIPEREEEGEGSLKETNFESEDENEKEMQEMSNDSLGSISMVATDLSDIDSSSLSNISEAQNKKPSWIETYRERMGRIIREEVPHPGEKFLGKKCWESLPIQMTRLIFRDPVMQMRAGRFIGSFFEKGQLDEDLDYDEIHERERMEIEERRQEEEAEAVRDYDSRKEEESSSESAVSEVSVVSFRDVYPEERPTDRTSRSMVVDERVREIKKKSGIHEAARRVGL